MFMTDGPFVFHGGTAEAKVGGHAGGRNQQCSQEHHLTCTSHNSLLSVDLVTRLQPRGCLDDCTEYDHVNFIHPSGTSRLTAPRLRCGLSSLPQACSLPAASSRAAGYPTHRAYGSTGGARSAGTAPPKPRASQPL